MNVVDPIATTSLSDFAACFNLCVNYDEAPCAGFGFQSVVGGSEAGQCTLFQGFYSYATAVASAGYDSGVSGQF